MNTFSWPLFFTLLAAGLFGTVAVLPYAMALNPEALDQLQAKMSASRRPLPPTLVLVLASLLQGGLLVAIAAYLGLLASHAVGLGLPVLQAALAGQPFSGQLMAMLPASLLVGFVGGALILVGERFVFMPHLPTLFRSITARHISFWRSLLACFYGGVVEELLMRLLVMAGLTWLFGLAWKSSTGAPAIGAFWTANILATLLFGLGHLPATMRLAPLTPLVVTRAVLLNGIVGLGCGFLFMIYGLEAAIIAHFSADIVIHLIGPALFKDMANI
jgi:hypothetical protein